MSEPYVGEIRMVGSNFAPQGWALCDGRLLSIVENQVLYSLIGTTYGGDGQANFALPDLRGRIPVHQGRSPSTGTVYPMGQKTGTETVTLTSNDLPVHTHAAAASNSAGELNNPTNAFWAQSPLTQYASAAPDSQMKAGVVGAAGGNQPHDNMMPTLTINYIIALVGVYPSQN